MGVDEALQTVMPTVMVPRFRPFVELHKPGNRVLMASNGVWLEIKREWLYIRVQIGPQLPMALPYGTIEPARRFEFDALPRVYLDRFVQEAKRKLPNECAAWVIWNSVTHDWRMEMLLETSVSMDHVITLLPVLAENEHLVVDIHSHGASPAFFSTTDNKDDRGECKIAYVVGTLDKAADVIGRLCFNGFSVPL